MASTETHCSRDKHRIEAFPLPTTLCNRSPVLSRSRSLSASQRKMKNMHIRCVLSPFPLNRLFAVLLSHSARLSLFVHSIRFYCFLSFLLLLLFFSLFSFHQISEHIFYHVVRCYFMLFLGALFLFGK